MDLFMAGNFFAPPQLGLQVNEFEPAVKGQYMDSIFPRY